MINLSDDRWREVHLRWPEKRIDPVQRQTFYRMQEVGPSGTDAFRIDMILTQNSAWGACLDKALHQYRNVFRGIPFARYIMTSLSLSILSIVLMIFSCSLSAYAFARLRWPGRDTFFIVMLATMMIPPQVTMIPTFLIFKWIGWYDTLLPLWVPAAFGAPFFIFLLRQFLKTIPDDLEDAARIDGCGFLRVYWHVMLPLIIPTLAIIAVYTFTATWNNFMGPLIYVNDDRLFPLALGLFKFNLRAGPDAGLVMAASFVMTLPVIVLFFFVQRYFIQGVTLTGMKG
ncbi:MAG: carbohydrate ABC transporter permease [Phycisphaeraceae bacterium]